MNMKHIAVADTVIKGQRPTGIEGVWQSKKLWPVGLN